MRVVRRSESVGAGEPAVGFIFPCLYWCARAWRAWSNPPHSRRGALAVVVPLVRCRPRLVSRGSSRWQSQASVCDRAVAKCWCTVTASRWQELACPSRAGQLVYAAVVCHDMSCTPRSAAVLPTTPVSALSQCSERRPVFTRVMHILWRPCLVTCAADALMKRRGLGRGDCCLGTPVVTIVSTGDRAVSPCGGVSQQDGLG
jgi:hypothetical protein